LERCWLALLASVLRITPVLPNICFLQQSKHFVKKCVTRAKVLLIASETDKEKSRVVSDWQ